MQEENKITGKDTDLTLEYLIDCENCGKDNVMYDHIEPDETYMLFKELAIPAMIPYISSLQKYCDIDLLL